MWMTHENGFTLIEMIVYIALFALLLVGGITAAAQLSLTNSHLQIGTGTQEEGNFVIQKMRWALSGSDVAAPTGSGCNQALSMNKLNFAHNPIIFQRNATTHAIEIVEGMGGGAPVSLTSTNVNAECLAFTEIPASGNRPKGVTATVTIDGKVFALTSYARK